MNIYLNIAFVVIAAIVFVAASSLIVKLAAVVSFAVAGYTIYRQFYAAPAALAEVDAEIVEKIKPLTDRAAEVEAAVESALRDRLATKPATPAAPVAPVVPAAPEAPKAPTTPPTV